jgi:hypothetical protein
MSEAESFLTAILTVDALEGNLARLEYGELFLDVPLAWLPKIEEGDVLHVKVIAPGQLEFVVDVAAKKVALERISAKLEKLSSGTLEGDITV